MSPAAVDFQSPFTVKTSSSLQNPNSNPNLSSFTSEDDLPQNQPQSTQVNPSTGFGTGTEFGFGIGSAAGNGNGFASHAGSRVGRGWSKPRLVKMRKHMGKSRAGAGESFSGFNPFVSKGDDSSSTNNCSVDAPLSRNSASEQTSDSNKGSVSSGFSFVNKEKVGFVFGANSSDASTNSYSQEHQPGENQETSASDDVWEMKKGVSEAEAENNENLGSVFEPNMSKLGLNLNWETREYNTCAEAVHSGFGEKVNEAECRSGCNLKFQLGAAENDLNSENVEIPASEDVNQHDFHSGLNPGKSEANGNESASGFRFVFGDSAWNSASDRKSEKNDSGGNDNCKSRFVSESSSDSCNKATASGVDPASKLPNEMEKLNIDANQKGDGVAKKREKDKNSGTNPGSMFFFGKPDPTNLSTLGPSGFYQRNSEDDFVNGGKDHNITRSSCDLNNASDGSFCSEPFTTQAGLFKNCDADLFCSSKVTFDTQTNFAAAPASLPANDPEVEATSTSGVQKNDEQSPMNTTIFRSETTIPKGGLFCFGANPFPDVNKQPEFGVKSKPRKDQRLKKTRGKLKQSSLNRQGPRQDLVQNKSDCQENLKSPECGSPMDFSPYVEHTATDQPLKETSMTSNDETLVNDVKTGDQNCRQPSQESSGCYHESSLGSGPFKEPIIGPESAYPGFKQEQASFSGAGGASVKDTGDIKTESHASNSNPFALGVENRQFFTFSSSSATEGGITSRRRLLRRRNRKKVGEDSFIISPKPNVEVSSTVFQFSPHSGSLQGLEVDKISKLGSISFTPAFEEVCEMWRLRGNDAYKKGNLSEAEDFYTQGIKSVPSTKAEGCCMKPLALCYSNRAATRISLGRMREALDDCVLAAEVDPAFLKVYVRAANCHLVLGEVENAIQYYNKLLELGSGVCLDRRITLEAVDGLQKAQKVAEFITRSADLLEQKTSEAASNVLEIIAEALSISSCSEKLLELKAEALCTLRRYEEAIQLCERTLCIAEKNFALPVAKSYSLARLWRWRLISRSYFFMGRLEAALDLLQKLEHVGSVGDKYGDQVLESSASLATNIRELIRCKNAGNEAVKSGKYAEAVEQYTVALSSNIESRPFAAICFCNRAAAHQALGNIADAIADCSLAMALDGNYSKAVSRRAALHEMIRDYTQAATDLQKLISILEHQSDDKTKQSGSQGRSACGKEIRQARKRLSLMEEEAKKGVPLDFYQILGVKASDAATDIKKAYRKAALRHHPDKAGQFLAKIESGHEGQLWKEIAHEVHKDADRLFKMIGEAYGILADTTKRSEYDLEEEMRRTAKERESYASSPYYRRQSDAFGNSFRRSASRQYWQESWKTHGNSYSRW